MGGLGSFLLVLFAGLQLIPPFYDSFWRPRVVGPGSTPVSLDETLETTSVLTGSPSCVEVLEPIPTMKGATACDGRVSFSINIQAGLNQIRLSTGGSSTPITVPKSETKDIGKGCTAQLDDIRRLSLQSAYVAYLTVNCKED